MDRHTINRFKNVTLLFFVMFSLIGNVSYAQQDSTDATQFRELLNKNCVSCHNDALKTAGLALDNANIHDVSEDPEIWEKVIIKLSLRAMPPVGMPVRPTEQEYQDILGYLYSELDKAAKDDSNPGRPTVHRLNRTEYANAIRDLLALEIDAQALLPPDNLGDGFDNIAEILSVSPVLMERYMFAAGRVSRMAIGPKSMQPASERYNVPSEYRQNYQMSEDLPFGSRGGTLVKHFFPQDGEYTIKVELERNIEGYIRGLRSKHTVDIRVDHEQIGTTEIGGEYFGRSGPIFTENQVVHYSGDPEQVGYEFTADEEMVYRFVAKAGTHLVGVTFVGKNTKPTGIFEPVLPLADIQSYKGGDPEIASITITGPFEATGPGDTPSRQKIFVCEPSSMRDEACARQILGRIARLAYRRSVEKNEIDELIHLFRSGIEDGGFEGGIELALQSILAGPEFLFRIEQDPSGLAGGAVYPISDLELASRLSFFLWSTIPDDELLKAAQNGNLRSRGELKRQVERMISDPRSSAFMNNFGRQWLAVRNIDNSSPNQEIFPEFDEELRQAFKQELMLWFVSMVKNDESILEVLSSNYTFVNERLARHYGMPDIYGSRFRKVDLASYEQRQGLFGKGGILMGTAFNNRTSPVVRGKWVLETLLNMPPPPPPDNIVPTLILEDEAGKVFTIKEAMEAHRANPVCAACHKLMDPIGFALENFDAVGSYRARYDDADADVDSSGILFDGNPFDDTDGFKSNFNQHSKRFATTVAQKLMTYAMGRSLEYYDMPAIRDIVAKMEKEDYKWSSLILGIIESTPFQYRRVRK